MVFAAVLSSCSLFKKIHPTVGPSFKFHVVAEERANRNFPIAVDLVLVNDKQLRERLAAMPASVWFSEREQFKKDLLGSPKMRTESWEWAPGQKFTEPIPVAFPRRGWAAFVFANYTTPGPHRVRVDPYKEFTLHLGRDGVAVLPVDGKKARK